MSSAAIHLAAAATDGFSEDPWPTACLCCGCRRMRFDPVLWPALIAEWRLAPDEVAYIDRQQGLRCLACGAALRTMALALAVMRCFGFEGRFADWVRTREAQTLRVLEVNEAGQLTPYLRNLSGFVPARYPEVDMQALPFEKSTFDLVLHSDTLEHVTHPVQALRECCRVLRPGGFCAFTVPMILDRMTLSRAGLPPSYHGFAGEQATDWIVRTEYGADAWRHVIEAGFAGCRIVSLAYPAAQALVGEKKQMPLLVATGERYLPGQSGRIRYEHLHRYRLAGNLVAGKDVLDIACGEGYGCDLMAGFAAEVVGVDIDVDTIQHARQIYGQRGNVRFLVGSCEAIPLADHSVDVVTSFETIEHHDKHEEMMREIKRVLRPKGLLILSSPNRVIYSEASGHVNPFHVKELNGEELLALLRGHFAFVQVFGQRMAGGSFVYRLDGHEACGGCLRPLIEASETTRTGDELLPAMYYLAVCSESPLPDEDLRGLATVLLDPSADVIEEMERDFSSVSDSLTRHAANLEEQNRHLSRYNDELMRQYEQATRHAENLNHHNEELRNHADTVTQQNERLTQQVNSILASRRWRAMQKLAPAYHACRSLLARHRGKGAVDGR